MNYGIKVFFPPEACFDAYTYCLDEMGGEELNIIVSVGNDKKEVRFSVGKDATVGEVRKVFAKEKGGLSVHQVSLKQGETRLDDDSKKFAEVAKAPYMVEFKNLGPQIGYRTVFYVEYFGPMLFVGLFAGCRMGLLGSDLQRTVFGDKANVEMNSVALTCIYCWMAHFLKREFETAFVHKFSRPTMPLSNLFKNCTYYWLFGAFIGHPLCSPKFALEAANPLVQAGLAIFVVSELGNLYCHIKLGSMRPAEGSKKRDIPKGFMFDLVACPNYFFEVMSWVGFSAMTQLPASYLFTAAGLYQMSEWALKKHSEYKKTYGKEYTDLKRKAILPFIL